MDIIDDFTGEHSFLSNFFPSVIRIPNADWEYRTVEHFFQAQKVPRHSPEHQEIQEAKTPGEAKKLGRQLRVRRDWERVKVGIMLAGLNYKFRTRESMTKRLIDTGEAILVEGNTWNDRFWGASVIEGQYIGLNMLGVLLMHVRQQLHAGFDTRAGLRD